MIGIFDSGSGWLSTLKYFRQLHPQYDYLYLGDYPNCPYGDRSANEVFELTRDGVQKLFDAGCQIVILACNTAITHSIRQLQSGDFIHKKILGVTITAGEKIQELGLKHVTVLATKWTVTSRLYTNRMHIYNTNIIVDEIPLSWLVEVIEEHFDRDTMSLSPSGNIPITQYLTSKIPNLQEGNQAIILGCTHYSWIYHLISELYPDNIIIDPSYEAAIKFKNYLKKHADLECKIWRSGALRFL